MMPKLKWAFVLFSMGLILCASLQAAPDKMAVKAGRIITGHGEDIINGTILIEGGKIKAIGKDLEIPYDFWVVDAKDSVVFPGMVQAFTSSGLDQSNESLPVTPWLNVYDAIDPSSSHFENALRDGVTTLFVSQGGNTVISGLARAVKPIGMTPDEMTVKPDAGLLLSFAPKSRSDRLVQMATFRETFRELEAYLDKLGEKKYEEKIKKEEKTLDVAPKEARKLGRELIKDEDLDFKHKNLVRLKRGEFLAILYCAAPIDVAHAIDTAKEQGFLDQSVFLLGPACYKAADLIKESGRPVILTSTMVYTKKDPISGDEEEIFTPLVYHKAGIPFAVTAQATSAFGTQYLWYQAARLVRNGIPREVAIKSITSIAAQVTGLDKRVGAMAPGLDGNLLILSSDPLEGNAWVQKVVIEGKLVYELEKDYRLKELITGKEIKSDSKDKEK